MFSSFDSTSSAELMRHLKDIRDRAPRRTYYNLTVALPERTFFQRKYVLHDDYATAIQIYGQFVAIYEPEELIAGEWLYASRALEELSRRFGNYNTFLVNLESSWETARRRLGGDFLRPGKPGELTLIERHTLVMDFLDESLKADPTIEPLIAVDAVESLLMNAIEASHPKRPADSSLEQDLAKVDELRAQAMVLTLS